ncbi:MAG: autotransporter outer membrane beta-barrel domain-containing protein [Spirochaetaceae bacterium]|jgi:hypothetical protein|nr:autotransporter outer membrane beta-barrel domain-containing protein [Spirochaetaceae bacterium]
MKGKIVFGLLLMLAITAGLSAQQTKTIAVGVDAMPLFKGFIWTDNDADNSLFALSPSFEYAAVPHFSICGTADLWFGELGKVDIFYFGLAIHGRWYPLSAGLDKLFLDAGLGFNSFSVNGETDAKFGGFSGLTIGLKAGWKLLMGQTFFMEPSMAYVYAKSGNVPTPLGWQAGLSIGMAF